MKRRDGSQGVRGSLLCQMIQIGEGKEGLMRTVLSHWRNVVQFWERGRGTAGKCPSQVSVHFKTSLESGSHGRALFTLIILYQVGVASCSV